MRNLVWTFWLALILAIIGTFISSAILINQWNNYMYYSEIEGRPNYPLFELSKEIENTLENQGNLEDLLLKNPISKFGDIYLIDSSGLDVLRRTLPEEIVIKSNSQPITKQPKFTQTIKLDTGETFFLIFSFDLEQRPIWNLFKRIGLLWIFFKAVIISGLISWWLASKTVRPIQKIALVSRLHGEGDLHAQIDKEILERKDEIGLLARQLKTSGIKIEELIKKQKDFLRDVSHEVRTPLARMQIAVETLELDTSDEKSMNQIKNEVLIVDKLVQDLLHLSHFDHPSKNHKIDTITVYNLVHQCIDRSKILARSKNILIKVLDKIEQIEKDGDKTYWNKITEVKPKDAANQYCYVKVVIKESDNQLIKEEILECADGRSRVDAPTYWQLFAEFYYANTNTPKYCRKYDRKKHAFKSPGKVCLSINGEWEVK